MIARTLFKSALLFSTLLLLGVSGRAASSDVILVTAAQNPIDELDAREVNSLYKGRLTTIKGIPLKPLNAPPGSIHRTKFLAQILKLDESGYTGYWHVRRYSGQGTPPAEISDEKELFETLRLQPDRVGYLWTPAGKEIKLPEGLKIIRLKEK
ncbi:hypothetical protein [Limnobacter parvus]|uniref:Phosphate ABC transporter substrate-binding protein n=1 Tax=Limnobacter parvus TaxID=2939690 RepID=A0ABT1XCN8_9BURK|nr:hypothetical protein [Limnobacter parvus]MCR2745047.1 hypothetical protein [Limnobacter parvus]